jgi:hypothetical protein
LAIQLPDSFGPYAHISHLRVDEQHGDAYSVWRAQGMPANPSAQEIAELQRAMEPSSFVPDRSVAVTGSGLVRLDFDLPRFGVSLLTISPALSASDGGSSASPLKPRGGCACRLRATSDDASQEPAPLELGLLILGITLVRRRRARAHVRAESRTRRATAPARP